MRCLIIDDDEDDFHLIAETLRAAATPPIEIDWADTFDVGKARLLADDGGVDVCLTDNRIGAQTGVEFIRSMRAAGAFTPMILMTGVGSDEIDRAAADAGAYAYLEKQGLAKDALERSLRYAVAQAKQLEELNAETTALQMSMIANVSHELRTPLNAIMGFAEMINRQIAGPVGDDYLEYAGHIEASSRHLLRLINRIILLGELRCRKGRRGARMVDLRLDEVLRRSMGVVREKAAEKNVSILSRIDPLRPQVLGDPVLLQTLIEEVACNAVKFSPRDGEVRIDITETADAMAVIEVSDSGGGVEADVLGGVFDEFVQGERAMTKRHDGLGIGLSLVQEIVTQHDGVVDIASTPGQGATVTIMLPSVGHAATAPGGAPSIN